MTITNQPYYSQARQLTRVLFTTIQQMKNMQEPWNYLDYSNNLADEITGSGNTFLTKTDLAAVIFTTIGAIEDLLAQGHGTNLAKLL